MAGWLHYLELKVRAKTGFSTPLLVFALIALVAAVAALAFLILAAFIYLAEAWGPGAAALIMCGAFLVIAIAAAIGVIMAQRRAIANAQIALAARQNTPWLDPRLLGMGMQAGRLIGWKKIVPLAAVGLLAAGLAREWMARSQSTRDDPGAPEPPDES